MGRENALNCKSVLHIITTIERGGAESQLLLLAKQQVALGRAVQIVFLKGKPELAENFYNIGVDILPGYANKNPVHQFWKLYRLLRKVTPIVHAHLPRAELLTRLAIRNQVFLVTRHNSEPFFPKYPNHASRILSRYITSRSHKVIAISNSVRHFLIERGEISNVSKIHVVYYGYQEQIENKKKLSNTRHMSLRIGTVARLTKQKNLESLINAFAIVIQEFPDSSLLIVGDGPLHAQLKNLSIALGIQENVEFLGRIDDVYSFMKKLDVFVLPSKYEGFGMVLLEAIDVGVPVIASRVSSIPEVLGESFDGLYESGNVSELALKIVMTSKAQFRNRLLAKQSLRLQPFNALEMAKQVESLYFYACQVRSPT
jgi:glycosyltransferase involved in cell wall biosynthesis